MIGKDLTKKGSIMKVRHNLVAMAVVLLGISGVAKADEIIVSAAASLTNAFKDLATQYEKEHDTKVLPSFAASDVLMQQIINGAPVDVFASADQKAMDKAVDAGVIDASSRQDFVRNEVVLIVPAKDDHNITSVKDLAADPITRIAFGNPDTVPVGRYTQASLEQGGNWDMVKGKEVLGQNVRQVLDYVARGEVDAGFVFATDAAIMPDKVTVVERLESPIPVLYPIALVKRDGSHAKATSFLEYVLSDKGQSILTQYGFSAP